jgi:parvulin-like peptidyl-prolyl isomerase
MFEQKLAQLGLVVTEAQIDARIERLKREFFGGSERRFQEALREQGLTLADVRADVRSQLVSEALFVTVTATVSVSDADVAAYYASHRREFRKPAERDVAHILVRTRARIDDVHRRLRAGARFAALARRHSIDPGSRRQGGRLTIGRGQTVKAFDRVAFSLRTGTLSKPFRTQYGWHVVKALSPIRPGRQVPLREVRRAIREQLLQERRNEAMARWVAGLAGEYAGKIAYAPGFEPLR